jgi:hypothetical protein
MLTPAQYVTTPGGTGQSLGVWDRATIEGHLDIQFQNGPVAVAGINGVGLVDVLQVCADQARALQRGNSSRERAMVITKLDEALLWEQKRIEEENTREKALFRREGVASE